MLGQSGVLTLLGMGVVFGFLVIMVISVSIMGKIVQALGANRGVNVPADAQASGPARSTAVAAAITAAVTEYQKENSL
jgi:oxaloacetate decarboxylase gamma subunit